MPNKESQYIEFKPNWRDEYLKAIASFANDKGGELIVGMDDHGNPVGLKNAKRLLEDLPNKIRNTLEILRSKYLVSNIKFEGIHRRDILEYPYEALREAIINALIHRDYSGTSHIQIRVYSDKLIIMNEGRLPPEVPLERLKTNHLSVPRNPLLAQVFYYAGFIEAWGRGTEKIVENCLAQGLPEPDFLQENGVMSVIFYKDVWTEINLKKLHLNNRQVKAVMFVKEHGKISNKKYQELNAVSKPMASIDLRNLVDRNIFKRLGITGRGTEYVLEREKG